MIINDRIKNKTQFLTEPYVCTESAGGGGGRVTLVNFEEVCAVKDLSRVKRKIKMT